MTTLNELGVVRIPMRFGLHDYHPKIKVTQGDTAITLTWDLVDSHGLAVADTIVDVTPVLYVQSPDGAKVGSAEGKISEGVASIAVPSSLLSDVGENMAQVKYVDSTNEQKLSDNIFILDVTEDLEQGAVPGENAWFSLQEFQQAIEKQEELLDRYEQGLITQEELLAQVEANASSVSAIKTELQTALDNEVKRAADYEALKSTMETDWTAKITEVDSGWTTRKDAIDAIMAKLGENPVVELSEDIVEIEAVIKAVQHEADNGKNLYEESGELYREYVTVTGGTPTLTYDWRGYAITNDIKTWTVPGTQTKGRLYFKAQGTAKSHILVYTADGLNTYAAEIDNRTKHYSCDLDLTGGRNVLISTLPAWGQKVKIWDLEVR